MSESELTTSDFDSWTELVTKKVNAIGNFIVALDERILKIEKAIKELQDKRA